MPPHLLSPQGTLYFNSVHTKSITTHNEDFTETGVLRIVQDGTNMKLVYYREGVPPNEQPSIVFGADSVSLSSGTTNLEVTPTGVEGGGGGGGSAEVSGITVVETTLASLNLQGDVTNPAYTTGKHSVLKSTNDDLVLSGARALDGDDTHVVTVGELHAYKGNGATGSGDAVKVFGKDVSNNLATLNLGVHKSADYTNTGTTTARATLSSSGTADLTIRSGAEQLRLEATEAGANVRIASSTSVDVFPRVPDDSGDNPSGHLVIDHVTPGAVDGDGFNISSLVIKSTASSTLALEAGSGVVDVLGSLEIGNGGTKYRFTVNANGQLEVQKWVMGVLSKTVQVME
eukprot:jgi/Mesvir1/17767/Mv19004-RA.1